MNTMKLYNDNVYLSECTATVTDVTEKGVILDRTIFFPEGGGQSSDIGVLINSSDETTYPVIHASESGDAIIHEISNHNLQVGDNVICRINWPHRFDNMQRHCGEHLLSGAMYKLFGGVNRGFHMGEHFMTADINLEKDPSFTEVTWEMAMEAEEMVNSHIWQDLPVKAEEFSTGEEAAKMPLRKELAVDEDVRVVTIGNDDVIADCVACCGTHPTSTAQIGLLKIYKVEKNKGMFRIYFEAGKRAMEDYRAKHDILTALSNRYSTGIDELTDKIEKQEKRHEETKNTLNKLRNVLISQKTEEIKKELSTGVLFISRFYDEFTPEDIMKIGKNAIELSNGLVKTVGEEMDVDIYMQSYQEQMLRLALERHFETERENFCRRTFKIKTLALFFIDDITSYRAGEDGKKPYLLETFERLLKEKLIATIKGLDESEAGYREFLEASLSHIGECHGGYFAQDNSSSDEDIANEVNDILNGKKQLLAFRDKNGKYILRRFLFSKWTLKEGWDNPNVFTIAKLRSSGSETSKLQEVGRGLRLPVDECGNRISNQEFMLNYIVDFTEADFANKLIEQINSEVPGTVSVSLEQIKLVAEKMGKEDSLLMAELLMKKYIDTTLAIIPQNRAQFFEEYPLFKSGLESSKVKDRNKKSEKPIGIRKARFDEIKELWKVLNQRYTIWYDNTIDADLEKDLSEILENPSVFSEQVVSSHRDIVRSNGLQMRIETGNGVQYAVANSLHYGIFLKRVSLATNIPVAMMHRAICGYVDKHGNIDAKYFNEQTVGEIVRRFSDWKMATLQGRFNYKKTHGQPEATALTHNNGSVRENIAQGRIGIKIEEGKPMENYLYDTKAYDSPLELKNINAAIDEVIVYGKIPRNSIAIPTITGETYSPDFMYVVKKDNGEKELNIVVETKAVENESTLRGIEEAKIKCAEVFFKNLSVQGYNVYFRTQLNNKQMLQIVKEVLQE